nr:response regulator transcription factor [Corynebacterium lactis]
MKVLLAEDSALLREGLAGLLRAVGHEVEAVADADELRNAAQADAFDVIVTDVRMPPTMRDDGLQAVHDIRRGKPDQAVVVLSQYVAASYLDKLLEHGGFGYLLKERVSDVEQFVKALDEVRRGGTVVDPEVVAALMSAKEQEGQLGAGKRGRGGDGVGVGGSDGDGRGADSDSQVDGRSAGSDGDGRGCIADLTPREREVLKLMAQGLSNGEMEDALVLTSGAVSKHVANVFMKLGFRPEDNNRRVKAVLMWLRYAQMPG